MIQEILLQGIIQKESENTDSKTYPHFHGSTIYNSQIGKQPVSMHRW